MIDLVEKALDLDWEVVEDTSNHEFQLQKYTVNGTLYDFSFTAKSAKEFLDAVNEELQSFNTDEYVSDLTKKIDAGLDCDMTEEEMEADAEDAERILSELATALNIMFELTEIYFPVCEKLDWSYYLSDGYNSVELEKQSPAGEDFGFCVSADKFVDEIVEYAAYFDQEEHVKMFVDAKAHGFAGVPSIRELVDDAKAIDDMLRELACALQDARLGKPEPKPKKKWRIPVKWTVESIAEVEADSLDEAMDILASRSEVEFSVPEEENIVDADFNTDIDEVRELFNGGQEDD